MAPEEVLLRPELAYTQMEGAILAVLDKEEEKKGIIAKTHARRQEGRVLPQPHHPKLGKLCQLRDLEHKLHPILFDAHI